MKTTTSDEEKLQKKASDGRIPAKRARMTEMSEEGQGGGSSLSSSELMSLGNIEIWHIQAAQSNLAAI